MKTKVLQRNHSFWTGFVGGLAGGGVASGGMVARSTTIGGVSLPEVVGSELTALMPAPLFNFLHQTIGADAKPIFFYGILVGQCLVFALGGALYNRRINQENRFLQWYDGLLLALVLWLFAGLILLPLSVAGIFGAGLSAGYLAGLLSLGIVGLVFGLLFVLLPRLIARQIAARDVTGEKATALDPGEESYEALSRP